MFLSREHNEGHHGNIKTYNKSFESAEKFKICCHGANK
jgi:hypothetical protein